MVDASDSVLELALTLRHDVGKYVSRAARNLPRVAGGAGLSTDLPQALLDMLVADLYLTDGTHPALAVYEARVAASGVAERCAPAAIRTALEALMTLEPGVRQGDHQAVTQACELALAVDDACRAFVTVAGPTP